MTWRAYNKQLHYFLADRLSLCSVVDFKSTKAGKTYIKCEKCMSEVNTLFWGLLSNYETSSHKKRDKK